MMRYLAPTPRDGLASVPVPDFSVVIPVYQAATVIGQAIESVLAQTVQACEIIVCNDGSTDDLYDALAPFMSRIRVIDKENGGEASAKNAGMRAATGEFVAILDADDVFLPGRLERLGELASLRPDLDLLTTDSYLVVNGVRVRNCYTADFRFPSSGQRAAILCYNFLPFAAARRTAVIAMDGFDETLRNVPDWDLWLRMILAGARAGLVDEPLAEYRLGSTNVTSDRARVHRGKLETLEKAKRTLDLTHEDRAIVEAGIEDERRALALWDARDALRVRGPAARRACLRLLHTEGIGIRAKLNAAAGILAPRTASRALERRDHAGVETTAGIRVNAQTITMGPSTQRCSRPCAEVGSDGVLASMSSPRELDAVSLVLHRVSVQRPRALRELLLSDTQVFELTPPVGAPLPCFVVLDDSGSDRGRTAAAGEVAAVRARRGDVPISWGTSVSFSGASELLQWQFARGRCSIDEMRRDPSLVSGMQIGRWFGARWQIRVLRTAVTALPAPTACALARLAAMVPAADFGRVAADLAFWAGVRAAATDSEWSVLRATRTWLSAITESPTIPDQARSA